MNPTAVAVLEGQGTAAAAAANVLIGTDVQRAKILS